MTKRNKVMQMSEADAALVLLGKSPQSKLIRYVWACEQDDPTYISRNQESIERVIADVLKMHGLEARRIFSTMTVFDLILKAAHRLKITKRSEWYAQF